MSVTRSEIAAELTLRFPEVPLETLLKAIRVVEQTIAEGLKRREEVVVRGFGRWRMSKPAVNPKSVGTRGPCISRPFVRFRLVRRGKLLFPRKPHAPPS